MTCERFPVEGGHITICQRGKRWPRCGVPGCVAPAPFLCDFPIGQKKSGTCDAKLCEQHRVTVRCAVAATGLAPAEDSVDYCPPHAKLARDQPLLAGVTR